MLHIAMKHMTLEFIKSVKNVPNVYFFLQILSYKFLHFRGLVDKIKYTYAKLIYYFNYLIDISGCLEVGGSKTI